MQMKCYIRVALLRERENEIICKLNFELNLYVVKSVWTELTPPHNRYDIQSHHFEIKSVNDDIKN